MLRKVTYVFLAIAWLIVMTLPILAFVLAARGEIMVGNDMGSNGRLFMVTEDDLQGIGFQRVTKASYEACYRTSVRYLFWEGHSAGLNTDFCTCFDLDNGYAITAPSCSDIAQE